MKDPKRYLPDHPLANAGGCVALHRLAAWDAGILTDPSMEVHHIDGDHMNNDPSNLVACTHDEHARLHDWPGQFQRAKTHCPNGHPYDDENTYVTPTGFRQCRVCRRRLFLECKERKAELARWKELA